MSWQGSSASSRRVYHHAACLTLLNVDHVTSHASFSLSCTSMSSCILPCRVRSSQHASDQVQIHIDKGFDFDSEVETLRKHVGQIKKVVT